MPLSRKARLSLAAIAIAASACGGAPRPAEVAAAPQHASAPLARSLFSKDSTGSLSEDDLQRVLSSPIDVGFPARVGVVALEEPFHAESGSSVAEQGIVARALTRALERSPHVAQATDVSTDLPNPSGIEGLRTIAARYRTRYLLLCSARSVDESHLNNWAWLYPTLVGIFVAPGYTVESQGLVQASLLDVRTGTVLFTVLEPYETSRTTWLIGSERSQRKAEREALEQAVTRIADKVLARTHDVAVTSDKERASRVARGEGGS